MKMIDSAHDLRNLVDKARKIDAVAIDTEFVWNRTYFPRLGLIQIALSDEDCHLIDPLGVEDLSPLGELLADQRTVKILHDAPQDLAILHKVTGHVPKNTFDTRLAAGFACLSASLSLGNLIEELLDIKLEKNATRTNWLKRPLDQEQISYALDDVRYLRAARVILINRIIGPEIKAWLQEELDLLNSPRNYNGLNENNRYRKIRGAKSLDRQGLAILRELVVCRERIARKIDRPRGHVVNDSNLVEISKKRPTNLDQLYDTISLPDTVINRWGSQFIAAVQTGQACPKKNLPELERPIRMNKKNAQMLVYLQEFIQLKSGVQGIDPTLIGNNGELKKLVKILSKSSKSEMVRQMEGWRNVFLNDFFRFAT